MEKIFIKNRNNQNLALVIDKVEDPKGLAFIMHGLGGFKEQPHIQTFARAFKDSGYTAVLFDTTNTFGESEGNYENATVTNYYQDLEDVIRWAKEQDFYQEPFFLTGHSCGGISVALYAEAYPNEIKGLAPIATVVSGKLSLETPKNIELIKDWKESGWRVTESKSLPGVVKRLKWSHMEDRLRYDLLENVNALTMPVLMIVGDKDENTPLEHQQILFDKLPGPKEFHIVEGAEHNFRDQAYLNEIKSIMTNWIQSFDT